MAEVLDKNSPELELSGDAPRHYFFIRDYNRISINENESNMWHLVMWKSNRKNPSKVNFSIFSFLKRKMIGEQWFSPLQLKKGTLWNASTKIKSLNAHSTKCQMNRSTIFFTKFGTEQNWINTLIQNPANHLFKWFIHAKFTFAMAIFVFHLKWIEIRIDR